MWLGLVAPSCPLYYAHIICGVSGFAGVHHSEKYDFVSWDDENNYEIPNGKQ